MILVLSCSKKEDIKEDHVSYEDVKINSKSIGEYHNYLMELNIETYQNIISTSKNENLSSKEIINTLQEKTKEKMTKELNVSSEVYDKITDKIKYEVIEGKEDTFPDLNNQLNNIIDHARRIDGEYVIDLEKLSTLDDDFNSYLKKCKEIKSKYEGTDKELVISSIIDISISSHNFWNKRQATSRGDDENYRGVWQADVSGAVIGASWGATTGSFAGGIGAIPGGLLGSCISASYGSEAAGIWHVINRNNKEREKGKVNNNPKVTYNVKPLLPPVPPKKIPKPINK